MKNILLILAGLLILSACSDKYQSQKDLIIQRIKKVDENTYLNLKVEILEFNLDSIVSTKDSLNKILETWDPLLEKIYDSVSRSLNNWVYENISSLKIKTDSAHKRYLFFSKQPNREDECTDAFQAFMYYHREMEKYMERIRVKRFEVLMLIYKTFPFDISQFTYTNEYGRSRNYYDYVQYKRYLEQKENQTYYIYSCKYKEPNQEKNAYLIKTRHFIFDKNQKIILKSY